MVYFADTNGNLIMGRRMPDGSLSKRYITRTKSSVITTYVHSNKEYIPMYPNAVEGFETGYDPRARGWYKLAVEKKTLVWTDVYIFATDKMPGFSCALPVYYENGTLEGVVCVDIGIQNLSLFLGKIKITPNFQALHRRRRQEHPREASQAGRFAERAFRHTLKQREDRLCAEESQRPEGSRHGRGLRELRGEEILRFRDDADDRRQEVLLQYRVHRAREGQEPANRSRCSRRGHHGDSLSEQ